MKKFYAIATAVAVTLSASAATNARVNHQGEQLLNARNTAFTLSETGLNKTFVGGPMKVDKNKVRKADDLTPTTIPDPTGTYISVYFDDDDMMNSLAEVYKNDWTESFYLYNLLGEGTDIEVEVKYVDFATSETDYVTFPCVVIPGYGQVTLFTQNGLPYNLYLGGIQDGQFYIYTDDIEFVIDQENGTLFMPYSGTSVAFVNPNMMGGWVDDVEFYLTNGVASGLLADYNTGAMVPDEQPVYGFTAQESLYTLGFCYYPNALEFVLDPNSNAAVAVNQVLWNAMGNDGRPYDFYFVNSNNGEAKVNATYKADGDLLTLSITDPWAVYNEEIGAYDMGESTVITYDFAPQSLPDMPYETGVESVVVENGAAGQVEFFNLQGARISNPAAGQIVIRRQGNDVKKVIIR